MTSTTPHAPNMSATATATAADVAGATGRRAKIRETAEYNRPVKTRRTRAHLALAVAIIALGGLIAAYVATRVSHTHPVVVLRHTVTRGSVIHAGDLTTADLDTDPALHVVPESKLTSVVGKHARVDLAAGSNLTADSVTASNVLTPGQSLIGLALTAGQMPAIRLLPGDRVRIVTTSGGNGDTSASDSSPGSSSTSGPTTLDGTVVDAKTSSSAGTDQTVVDVAVSSADAPQLASDAAGGHIALILEANR